MLAFFLSAFIGPGQVSPDLANNALSLYLARPFSRAEYVLGKFTLLAALISLMTWIPGLLLFGLQSYLEGPAWMASHARIAVGLFLGSWIWIALISLLALALSAWVKWRPAAGGLLFGVFFVAAGFGQAINNVEETRWGQLLNIGSLVGTVWVRLFEGDSPVSNGGVFFRVSQASALPTTVCWVALIVVCLICLKMLAIKVRGAEVVR
jgi:ABC-2 type transport system permease protein